MAKDEKSDSSASIVLLFMFSLLSAGSSATLTVLLYLWGFMGFIGTPTLSITACTTQYHTTKYSDLTLINQTIFSGSATAAASGIMAFFISLCLLIQNCCSDNKRSKTSQCTRNILYIFVCLSIMGSAVEAGYYVGYVIEGNNCTFIYQNSEFLLFLILGGAILMFSLISFFIIICCLNVQGDRQEKYRQIQTKQTEPNHIQNVRKKQLKPYFTEAQQQFRPNFRERQETKQNIFDTPYKRAQKLNERNAVLVNNNYNSDPIEMQMRFVPRYKQQNPVLNMHPKLANDGVEQILSAKYNKTPQKRHNIEDDQRYLRQEQKKYLNNYNNRSPIIHAQEDTYGQRDRDFGGRPRNHRDDIYDDRDRNYRDDYGERERERRKRRDDYDRPPRGRGNHYDENPDDRDYNPNRYFRDHQPPRRRIQSPAAGFRNRDEHNYMGPHNY